MPTRRIRVSCITRIPRKEPFDRITHLGGTNVDGTRWKVSEERAILDIKQGDWEFYVHVGTQQVSVVVARSQAGDDYVKTAADRYRPDNLLSLPECP